MSERARSRIGWTVLWVALFVALWLEGCASTSGSSHPKVTILWPSEHVSMDKTGHYLWPKDVIWWTYEIGFGDDGRVYWRTNETWFLDAQNMAAWRAMMSSSFEQRFGREWDKAIGRSYERTEVNR